MSSAPQLAQQLQQELQNELTTSNQLLRLISLELQQIKQFTSPGGEFETIIKQVRFYRGSFLWVALRILDKNASLMETLANIQQIDITKLPPLKRIHIDVSNDVNQNLSHEQHDSFRDSSNMDETQ